MRKHWAHVSWATRGPYAKDSSQAFTSVWVTVLSPQWPAPGTCHRGLWDYLSIKLRWSPAPHPFLGFTMQVLANSLHPIPLSSLTPSFHTKMISLYVPTGAHHLPVPVCKLHVNYKSNILYSVSPWINYCSVAHSVLYWAKLQPCIWRRLACRILMQSSFNQEKVKAHIKASADRLWKDWVVWKN